MGRYPLESVRMLARIAAATEPFRKRHRHEHALREHMAGYVPDEMDVIAWSVENIIARNDRVAAGLTPTASGYSARSLARFRLPVWIIAVSPSEKTCQELQFSYGVFALLEKEHPGDWTAYARRYAAALGLEGTCIIQTEGPSPDHPSANYRMEIIKL